MDDVFTGIFVLDFNVLLLVMDSPVPSTPFLIFLFLTKNIFVTFTLYFFFSNILCIIFYLIGRLFEPSKLKITISKHFPNLKNPFFFKRL